MSFQDRDYYKPRGFGSFNLFPDMIKTLLIINLFVFLVQNLLQLMGDSLTIGNMTANYWFNYWFALHPFDYPFNFQVWQLITYQFMHGGFGHILFNMFALWMFGMELENLWGSKKFIIYYLAAGIGGGLAQILISNPDSITVGASGAIYGLLIAFAMLFPDRTIYFYFFIPMRARTFVFVLMGLEFFMLGRPSLTAHLAHLGGAITGLLFLFFDKSINFDIKDALMRKIRKLQNKSSSGSGFSSKKQDMNFRNPFRYKSSEPEIKEAQFYDIDEKKPGEDVPQEVIDQILDKISKSGYQNLTEKEKKILFEASKKK